MSNGIMAKISQLKRENKITEEEYRELRNELMSHDLGLKRSVIVDCSLVIGRIPNLCGNCPCKCEWGSEISCSRKWENYLKEKLKVDRRN